MTRRHLNLFLLAGCLTLGACDQADCPLDNNVTYTCNFYSGGEKIQLNDILTVTALGTDSVLVNQMQDAAGITLPMSYWNAADTLILTIQGDAYEMKDTVWVKKTNIPHFESPDCPTKMFHLITETGCTHTFIDSLSLIEPNVNYADVENIQIHFHPAN